MVRARGLGVLIVATFVAVACGGGSSGGGTKGTIKIGVDLPESGAAASSGLPTLHGVEFAIKVMNDAGGLEGYKFEVSNFDDAVGGVYNEQKGVQNVQQMIGDSKVLGMIGPFNSAVAKAEIPVAAAAHFTMISPSNTSPCLTKLAPTVCNYDPATLRGGNPNNYFRVVTTDDFQGPAMADYAYKNLNIKNIGVLSDSTVFGKGIADAFQDRFKTLGGTYKRLDFPGKTQTDFKTLLLALKNSGAQGLYVGGTDDQKSCVPRSQMQAVGFDVPFLGGDGIETSQCIEDAGSNNLNVSATSAGADATQVPGAKATLDAYKKVFSGPNDLGGYTMQAYDAATALMQAIGRAIKDANGNVPTREQVRAQMAQTKGFKGAVGTYNFDATGDTDLRIVSIYTTKSVSDPAQSSGVCGKKADHICFVWQQQVTFA